MSLPADREVGIIRESDLCLSDFHLFGEARAQSRHKSQSWLFPVRFFNIRFGFIQITIQRVHVSTFAIRGERDLVVA